MIDRSGEWWIGESYGDLVQYVSAYAVENYAADEIVRSACQPCGERLFALVVDDDEGCAQRVCCNCNDSKFIADSSEYWDDADPGEAACPCGQGAFELAVGFSLLEDRREVRWITVGGRCVGCGVLGVYVDWKVGYEPSGHLIEQA